MMLLRCACAGNVRRPVPKLRYIQGAKSLRTTCQIKSISASSKKVLQTPNRRMKSTLSRDFHAAEVEQPTARQLRAHFLTCAVPMFGFGLMDNTVMIQAGNAIDCTLGVTFGLSTLAAAACGQIVANGGGILFGGYVERLVVRAGLPPANLRSAQLALPLVKRAGLLGSFVGVTIGAAVGLVNLWFIDTNQSTLLKIQAIGEQEFDFEIEASNTTRHDATTLTVKGPDVDGMLASVAQVLTEQGYSLVEVHASPRQNEEGYSGSHVADGMIEDVFVVRPRGEKHRKQVDDDELDDLANTLLAACKDPLSAHTLKAKVTDLEATKQDLEDRVRILEKAVAERQIRVVRSMH